MIAALALTPLPVGTALTPTPLPKGEGLTRHDRTPLACGRGAGGEGSRSVWRGVSTGRPLAFSDHGGNLQQYGVEIIEHLGIRETHNPQMLGNRHFIAPGIIGTVFLIEMDSSINFDHQFELGRVEIKDERAKRMLSSKFDPTQLSVAQRMPKQLLSGCQLPPHRLRISMKLTGCGHTAILQPALTPTPLPKGEGLKRHDRPPLSCGRGAGGEGGRTRARDECGRSAQP